MDNSNKEETVPNTTTNTFLKENGTEVEQNDAENISESEDIPDLDAPLPEKPQTPHKVRIMRAAIVGLILLAVIIVIATVDIAQALQDLLEWIDELDGLGVLVVFASYVIFAVIFIPTTLITAGCGFIYGFGIGVIVAIVGFNLGTFAAFSFARYMVKDMVLEWIEKNETVRALYFAIEGDAAKLLVAARIAPIISDSAITYVFSASDMKTLKFLLASGTGSIPYIAMMTFVGSLFSNLSDLSNQTGDYKQTRYLVMYIVGAIVSVLVVGYVFVRARKIIRKSIESSKKRAKNKENGK